MNFDGEGQFTAEYTRADCIDALHEAASVLGESPSTRQYQTLDIEPSMSTIKKHFGSWNEAKKAAGLETYTACYDIDLTYFSTLDEEASYWLGFCYGDAAVSHRDRAKRVAVTLQARDQSHLETFREAIGAGSVPIYEFEQNGFDYVRLSIGQAPFVEELERHGLTPEKTHSGSLPDLDEALWPHFVRGLFDADGSVKGTNVAIHSQQNRLEKIQSKLPESGTISERTDSSVLYFRDGEMEALRGWLYPAGHRTEPALERKRTKVLEDVTKPTADSNSRTEP